MCIVIFSDICEIPTYQIIVRVCTGDKIPRRITDITQIWCLSLHNNTMDDQRFLDNNPSCSDNTYSNQQSLTMN